MPYIQLKDYTCNYEHIDNGKDKTLVFSNSLGTNLSMWDPQVNFLKEHANILLHDTQGHGKSDHSTSELKIEQLGEDVIQLLDYLEIRNAYFCGISMGGLIGQYLGIHYPERFTKIVLANTAAKIGTIDGWNTRIDTVQKHGLKHIIPSTSERWFTPEYQHKEPQKVDRILASFAANPIHGYCANCAAVRDADFIKQVHLIKSATLILAGEHDVVTTLEDARFLRENISDAIQVNLPGAHLSSMECEDAFNQAVFAFITND